MSNPKETLLPEFLALNHRGKTPSPSTKASPFCTTSKHIIQPDLYFLRSLTALHMLVPSRIQETENLRLIYEELEDAHFDAEHANEKLGASERSHLIAAVDKELDYWETYAENTAFMAGDEFGLADCALFPILAYMVHRGFEWRRQEDTGFKDAWPYLNAYYHRVWERGGKDGCAQRSQPDGWNGGGKANVWRGTKRNAKGLSNKQRYVQVPRLVL
ncbi:hypothetical protein C0991_010158 [Blastosporella zonata]|nr:hypothetical protein C0991_010158 [Blastosporella zonata]